MGSSQFSLFSQQDLNTDLYKPLPLQHFTPPKDTSYKDNKLVIFNMLEKRFDTVQTGNNIHKLIKKFGYSDNDQHNPTANTSNEPDFTFSNILPADQLAEFPNYPISPVVKLFLTFFNPSNNQTRFATCSGILIHPGFILTGGHCVKSKFDSSYAVSCTVVPAYNLGSRPFGLTTTTNWYSFTQWTMNGNLDYDMAIMSLANPIGNNTGWLDWGYHPDDSFFTSSSNVFYSFGYPGYDPIGNPVFEEGERMYYMSGNMDFHQSKNTMCHNNIGYQGQSGSGLYYKDSSNNRTVYGVLSHGNLFPPYFTCHCRMDSSMFNHFSSIIPNISKVQTNHFTRQIPVYPNPSGGVFNIDLSEFPDKEIKIQVLDFLGRKIELESPNRSNSIVTIDLTSYPKGTYFIQASIEGKLVNGRIFKTN